MLDLTLRLSPVTVRLRSAFSSVGRHMETFYPSALRLASNSPWFIDFDLRINNTIFPRSLLRPQARFLLDDVEPFLPLPAEQAAPLFEWGLNWAIASRPLGYLVMHAAVVARDDAALVMPGEPGAGKSTLCAALTFLDGWRLLSDELAILAPESSQLQASPRPICIKNHSIDVVTAMPGTRLGSIYRDTRKGTVTHAAAPETSQSTPKPAKCRWIVFPHFSATDAPYCEEIGRAEAFARIAEQSFNRDRMGESGFRALCAMLDEARCFEIGYRSSDEARAWIREITEH